jgi:tRNA A-37 threonylcarbamoyl transferase component Bud32
MSRLLRCTHGHEWHSDASGSPSVCPVCSQDTIASTVLVPAPQPTAEPPPNITGYEILAEVGRGGMGIVYKARDLTRNRDVALKVILKERIANAEALQRFRREAQAAARLSHPNIVAVYDYDQDGDTHYLAMEFVPGLTLQRLVDQSGPLAVPHACDFVRQLALGLQHASEQALVHRDIKPSNVMAVMPGSRLPPRPLVKLLDMGVARLYQARDFQNDSITTLTRDGVVVGTPDYIAPEQLENPHGADIRADLYSLGCTFYFLLSGQVPFPGGTLIQKLDRQRWEHPASVDQVRSEVPAAVAAVVRRLMAKHPDDRYRTPGELAAALEQLARTGTLPAGHQPEAIEATRTFTGHAGLVLGVCFLPDGQSAVSAATDRTVRLWDVTTGTERRRVCESLHEIGCLTVSPTTGEVFVGQGASVRLYDPQTGREIQRFTGHIDAVRCLCVSADGRVALSAGDDRTVRVWDVASGRETQRFTKHRARITGVALSPDGERAVSGGHDQTLRLWETQSGRELRTFAVPRGPILCVAFAPDGRLIASGHFDTAIRLWDADSGREERRFTGHRQMVSSVLLSASGVVLSASYDQTIRGWDAASGSELWCGASHAGPVTGLALSPNGTQLLSSSFDQTLRSWQVPH